MVPIPSSESVVCVIVIHARVENRFACYVLYGMLFAPLEKPPSPVRRCSAYVTSRSRESEIESLSVQSLPALLSTNNQSTRLRFTPASTNLQSTMLRPITRTLTRSSTAAAAAPRMATGVQIPLRSTPIAGARALHATPRAQEETPPEGKVSRRGALFALSRLS